MAMASADHEQESMHDEEVLTRNKMSDSTYSLTDVTLEQAMVKLQEIERENLALKENLRTHNAIVKKQYDALAEWRKKENEKFEQTKAYIISLKEETRDLQVKAMAFTDKEKDLTLRIQNYEEEIARLIRQKAMSDQRLFNVYKMAEEQGLEGLVQQEEAHDVSDTVIVMATSENAEAISQLEATVASKEELIAQLRADMLKKDEEIAKCKDTSKQLLKDLESQQRLKESTEEENRMLTKQILHAEQRLHKHMQAVMATTKREMQAEQMMSSPPFTISDGSSTPATEPGLQVERHTNGDTLSFPENMEDLVGIAKSLEAKQREEMSSDQLKQKLEEARKDNQVMKERTELLEKELQELTTKMEEKGRELEEVQQREVETAGKLAQEYERKLMEVAKNSNSKPIQASDTEDISILRSQVLALIREVDEAQNKLSAAMAALLHKDNRIIELDHQNQVLRKEYNDHWQETHVIIQNLRMQVSQQQKAQQENNHIKRQHEQLQDSFSTLVTDYKDLQETFEAYRLQMERQGPKKGRKEAMEEINRLTAQVIAADEAIALKDEELGKLRKDIKCNPQQEEKIQLLQFQADVFRSDFTAEREARNKLAEEKNALAEENDRLLQDLHCLQERNRAMAEELEGYNQRQLNDMQRRFQGGVNFEAAPHLRATPPLAQDYRHQQSDFRQQTPEYRTQMPDYRNQMPDYRNQTQDYRNQTQDYRTPTPDYRNQPPDYRTQMPDFRNPMPDYRNHTGEYRNPMPDYGHQAQNYRMYPTMVQPPKVGRDAQFAPTQQGEEDLQSFQDFECPWCAARFPDTDTLQLHVPDCMDNNR